MSSGKPEMQLRSIVLDCPDPAALARFYGELLGGEVHEDPDWSEVRFGPGSPKLAFQRVEPFVAPEWPNGLPQQLHLDITVPDLAVASVRALELGARVVQEPVDEGDSMYQVHLDPSGHPFCFVMQVQRADRL